MNRFAVLFIACTGLLLSPAIHSVKAFVQTTESHSQAQILADQAPPSLPYLPEPRVATPSVITALDTISSDPNLPYLPEPRVVTVS